MHGYVDYAGSAVNTKEIQDPQTSFLNMLATGAAPHYLFTYAPTRNMEFSPYEFYYSTQYENWIPYAVEHYRVYNEIFRDIRTEPITAHRILFESPDRVATVTVTEYGGRKRIYVNNTRQPYTAGGVTVPALGYFVEEVGR
jgi:hypothetical protein